jgi:predicted RNA binding protein YcfA (HicA-like mRNA interferase family)
MVKKRRLYLKALNNPRGLRFAEFTALVEAFGFRFRRQNGSHRLYGRADVHELVNI